MAQSLFSRAIRNGRCWTVPALLILALFACQPMESGQRPEAEDQGSITEDHQGSVTRGEEPQYAIVSIFWATDREPTGSTLPERMFGGDRGSSLSYGASDVSVPFDHKIGEIEGPRLWRFEFSRNPSRHMTLLSDGSRMYARSDWLDHVRQRTADDREAFIFIHGYNNSFEEAALRTAQIAYDLNFQGAPILYSWPSKASRLAYLADETNAEWSHSHLVEFLRDIRQNSGADRITLIAHSMGSRILGWALKTLSHEQSLVQGPLFHEIILAAPDIDADVFKTQIMPAMRTLAKGRTLYASSQDWALVASHGVHQAPRAGESGDSIVVVPDLETIDATRVRTDFHNDASSRAVLADMFYIVREGKRAFERAHLQQRQGPDGIFWLLRP